MTTQMISPLPFNFCLLRGLKDHLLQQEARSETKLHFERSNECKEQIQ